MDSDFTTGNRTVDRMSRINITGNIIPAAWYKTIRKSTGKPYLNAIVILSDMRGISHQCRWEVSLK